MAAHLIRIHRLAARFEPGIQRAVRTAIRRSRSATDLAAIEAELWRLSGLRRIRRLRRADFRALHQIVMARPVGRGVVERGDLDGMFRAGAEAGADELPPSARLAISFDRTNQEAVRYLERSEMRLIREIDDETRRGVEGIVRLGFTDGLQVREQARRIRETVGLTARQSRAVYNFRGQLLDQEIGAADRRLSASEKAQVRRHARVGHLTEARIERLVARYRESLVNRRALNIARTETLRASNAGQQALWESALAQDLIREDEAQREWVATLDDRVRPEHRAAHGQKVGLKEPFVVGGAEYMQPPAGVNCRCTTALAFGR